MKFTTMSIRRMMVLVAAVAASIVVGQWTWGMFELRNDYLSRSLQFQADAAAERRNVANFETARQAGKLDPADPKILSFERASRMRLDHKEAMALKYRKAAGRPWRPVPADPDDPGVKLLIAFFLGEEVRGQTNYAKQLQTYSTELNSYSSQLEAYANQLQRYKDILKSGQGSEPPGPGQERPAKRLPRLDVPIPLPPLPPIGPPLMDFGGSMMISLTPEAFPTVEVELRPGSPK